MTTILSPSNNLCYMEKSQREKEFMKPHFSISKQQREKPAKGAEDNNTIPHHVVQATKALRTLAKHGRMDDARNLFDKLEHRDVVLWNVLIQGYAENGQPQEALKLFSARGYEPNTRTFIAAIKSYTTLITREKKVEGDGKLKMNVLEIIMALHSLAESKHLCSDRFLCNSLVDMYAKCGSMVDSSRAFESIPHPDVIAWTCLIIGHAENGKPETALQYFTRMQAEGCVLDGRAYVAALKACTKLALKEDVKRGKLFKLSSLEKGFVIHALARKAGLDTGTFVGTSLADMYVNCGSMSDAWMVFSGMDCRDIVSWNVMLLGYAENGKPELALELFSGMTVEPNARTFVALFKSCSCMAIDEEASETGGNSRPFKLKALETGMMLHSLAAARGCERDIYVATSLLDMYTKCASMEDARRVFESIKTPSLATWNSLMLGYAENENGETVLKLLDEFLLRGLSPDARTFGAVLKACAVLGASHVGREVHADITRKGLVEKNSSLAACLVDCYGRCGNTAAAQQVFDGVEVNDIVTWSALVGGYSHQGEAPQALCSFEAMIEEGLQPDGLTLSSVISACGHAGLVERGRRYFIEMRSKYGVEVKIEHYHCVVDMLGRANRLEEAVCVVKSMPMRATGATWTTLLAACCRWNNVRVGKLAYESLVQLHQKVAAGHVI